MVYFTDDIAVDVVGTYLYKLYTRDERVCLVPSLDHNSRVKSQPFQRFLRTKVDPKRSRINFDEHLRMISNKTMHALLPLVLISNYERRLG